MNFHGGDLTGLKDICDYSSNINPLGAPKSFIKELKENLFEIEKYPDIHYNELKENIADYCGCHKNDVIPGNGAVDVIYKAISSCHVKNLLITSPTFSEYEKGGLIAGLDVQKTIAYDMDTMKFDPDKLKKYIQPDQMTVICNPNNPTGTLLNKELLCHFAQYLKENNSLLLIDESFIEFTDEFPKNSMADMIRHFDNIIIIRACTKFFGVPGIRLGYLLSGNKKIINRIYDVTEPWNINTYAHIAAKTIFTDFEYIESTKKWIKAERAFIGDMLEQIPAIKVFGTSCNFYLIKLLNGINGEGLKNSMLREGFLIRTAKGFYGLDDTYIRIAVKDKASNERFAYAFSNILMNRR